MIQRYIVVSPAQRARIHFYTDCPARARYMHRRQRFRFELSLAEEPTSPQWRSERYSLTFWYPLRPRAPRERCWAQDPTRNHPTWPRTLLHTDNYSLFFQTILRLHRWVKWTSFAIYVSGIMFMRPLTTSFSPLWCVVGDISENKWRSHASQHKKGLFYLILVRYTFMQLPIWYKSSKEPNKHPPVHIRLHYFLNTELLW